MYLATVVLLMAVLPVASVAVEHAHQHPAVPLIYLIGKWFVFWSAGVRLFLAGLRQFFQPGFTAQHIFNMRNDDAHPVIRELGVSNVATGVVGMASLARPSFILPVAVLAAIFYAVAGVRHAAEKQRSFNENIAMVSDLFVFLVLACYLASAALA